MATDCPSYYCGTEWDDITSALCAERFNGGMSFLLMFKCAVNREDIVQDGSPDQLDEAKIQSLINANQAKPIPFVQMTLNEPEEIAVDVLDPCSDDQVINYNRSLLIEDPNVNEVRRRFWSSVNSANLFANGGALIYECDANRWTYIDKQMSIAGGRTSPAKNAELQKFSLTASWRSKDDAEIFDASFVPSDLTY